MTSILVADCQQYIADTNFWVEHGHIQLIKILGNQYTGVSHFFNRLAEKKDAVVGEKIILTIIVSWLNGTIY